QDQGWKLRLYRHSADRVRLMLSSDVGMRNYPFETLLRVSGETIDMAAKDPAESRGFREIFVLLKGLLMTADWMASGHKDSATTLDASRHFVHLDPANLFGNVKTKVEADRKRRGDCTPFGGYRPFQEACGRAEGHVLAIAPTGSGKTEAACLWALRQVE